MVTNYVDFLGRFPKFDPKNMENCHYLHVFGQFAPFIHKIFSTLLPIMEELTHMVILRH